ncbi:MAG: preprotein translocase subunit SecG [Alphaproteobacteria bacterium]|nr:preprotein translocase subunit SecG [Alphaproteobacteria bacterium]
MIAVILVIHLILAIALVCVVLLQKSEGGALGLGGGGNFGGLMTTRGSANLLTRTTAVIATLFMITSLALAILATDRTAPRSILDRPGIGEPTLPQAPVAPSIPVVPSPPTQGR